MAPVKVPKKALKMDKLKEKPVVKVKKSKKKNYESFSIYILKVLRSIHKENIGISKKSMLIMNDVVNDMLEKIAVEAGKLVVHAKKSTLSLGDTISHRVAYAAALYDWYYMPTTVHKLLIHGGDIIENNAITPIGSLSEEASEARNKDFRRFREHHSRKKSRQSSNEDILNMLLVSSDPLISSIRPKQDAHKKQTYFEETLDLLNLQDHEPEIEFMDVMLAVDPDSEVDSDEDI